MRVFFDYIKKYFTIWWMPIIGYLITIGVFFIGILFRRDWIIDLSLIILFTNILGTIVSSIVQVVIKKWYFIFPQLGLGAFLFYWTSIIFTHSPPDYYGTHKEIPNNIDIEEPLESMPTQQHFDKYNLILVKSFQRGIYQYYTDYIPTEKGCFYIKVHEITTNDRLSAGRINEASKIIIKEIKPKRYDAEGIIYEDVWDNDKYDKKHTGRFTIYEGSWGDKYGSRIELWFKPLATNEEYKIAERNFIVEGWMR